MGRDHGASLMVGEDKAGIEKFRHGDGGDGACDDRGQREGGSLREKTWQDRYEGGFLREEECRYGGGSFRD